MTTAILPPSVPAAGPPAVPLMTAAEFFLRHERDRVELIRGVVRTVPMPSPSHGKICATLCRHLGNYAEERDSGHVMSNDSLIRTGSNPDTVRGPDVAYFSFERLPKGPVPRGLLDVSPNLVAEVRSPSDTWTEMFGKVNEYLKCGVDVVLILDPDTSTVSVYRPTTLQEIFKAADDLAVPEVLPGFAVRVGRLFE